MADGYVVGSNKKSKTMKKTLIAAAAALMMVSCNQQGGNYKVTATMPDATTDGQTAYLTDYDTGDTLGQAVISDKMVVLQGTVDTAYMARLIVNDNRMEFVVEPAEIAIDWQEQKATGGKLNEAFSALDAALNAIAQEDCGEDEEAQMALEKKLVDRFYKAYQDNRDNAIGPWAFNYYLMYNDFSAQQLDSIVNAAPQRYRNLKRVRQALAAASALANTAVGKPFTDFTDAKGTKLSDFAGKGKYTLVDFWASWCGPCRREIPNIKALYDKYNGKMNFVGVAVWDKSEDTHKAMQELQIPWPVMEGSENWTEPTDLYGIKGIPHIMLIDPDGKIVARNLAGALLTKTIDDLKL